MSSVAPQRYVTDTLTATGVSDSVMLAEGETAVIQVTGTFSATWGIVTRLVESGSFGDPIADTDADKTKTYTTTETKVIVAHSDMEVAVKCTAYTSGTLNVEIKR